MTCDDARPVRLTCVSADGSYELAPGADGADLVARLGAHEDALASLRAEYADAAAQIDRLRDEGRTRTATYRQLVANRITLKGILDRFAEVGL